MKINITRIFTGLVLLCILLNTSCRRMKDNQVTWDVNALTPILSSELTINEILLNNAIQTNSDSSLSLVYNNYLYSFNLADQVIHVPDTTFSNSFNLKSVGLPLKSIFNYYSLGKMSTNLPFPYNVLIQGSNNTVMAVPGMTIATQYQDVDFSNFVKVAYNSTGTLEFHIKNDLPFPLDSINIEFKNKMLGNIIDTIWMFNIPPNGAYVVRNKLLANDTIEGILQFRMANLKVVGTNGTGVLIDTSKGLDLKIVLRHFTADSAVAKFPNQNLMDTAQLVTYHEVGAGAQIDLIKIKEGRLHIRALSSIAGQIKFQFKMPCAISPNGQPFDETFNIDSANNGQFAIYDTFVDLTNYTFDFTGPAHNMHNTFFDTIRIKIDSTGQYVNLSKRDSIYAFYTFEDVVPEYARGYLGDTTFNFNSTNIPINIFNKIVAGGLSFDKMKFGFNINNGIGVQGNAIINSLSGTNTKNNTTVNLNVTDASIPVCNGSAININSATDQYPTGSIASNTAPVNITESNSNIKQMVENFPDLMNIAGSVSINPNGNVSNYHDFVYWNNKMNVNLSMEIPLSFVANNLTLIDTLNFNMGTPTKVDKIKDAVFTFYFENGFPIDAKLKIELYDANYSKIDAFTDIPTITGAELNSNCRATKANRTKYELKVDQNRMAKLKGVKYAVVTPIFNTSNLANCGSSKPKIYSDYKFSTKIVAKFNYIVTVK